MAEPLPPFHVFDFPANDPVLELEDPVIEVKEDPEENLDMDINEDEEDEWEEDEFLPWIPPTQPNTYEVGGPSSAVPKAPHPVGRPLSVLASRVVLHHREIEELCVRADKMEDMQTRALSLVRLMV
nr:hypothetical protein [Tanacetum cinerariifolium]GFA25671.1 hypothetical protein [Tanacetum cinerariifolium]GFA82943.1 hypothetical protein [Tanacetum cinerariifolium]